MGMGKIPIEIWIIRIGCIIGIRKKITHWRQSPHLKRLLVPCHPALLQAVAITVTGSKSCRSD